LLESCEQEQAMGNWKRCTRRDKSAVYLNLAAAIAIRPFEEGFSRVYFGAGSEDNKLYFDIVEAAESLIAEEPSE
jgi:hypothetical protein